MFPYVPLLDNKHREHALIKMAKPGMGQENRRGNKERHHHLFFGLLLFFLCHSYKHLIYIHGHAVCVKEILRELKRCDKWSPPHPHVKNQR